MITPRSLAQALAQRSTRFIAKHWGDHFPYYYVTEYPKSGGTWLAQMVGDYLQVPFPRFSIFPIGCKAVILNHWPYDPRLRKVFYLYRDGRDVMTSFFFHRLRIADQPSHPASGRVHRHLTALFGPDFRQRETGDLLARFIDHEFQRPGLGAKLSWAEHLNQWYAPEKRPHIAYVSYEGLLRDARGELARVIARATGEPADPSRIDATVTKFSMQAQTGRQPGQEDASHHVRKGVAGDWKNHFTRECAELFRRHAGDTLITFGYELDPNWVERMFPE